MKKIEDSFGTLKFPKITIMKYGYKTPEKKPFELPENLKVSPTHLTWTPNFDAWFDDDEDRFHCLALIQKLDTFPFN